MNGPEESIYRLIPELRAWNDGAGIDPETWFSIVVTPEHAIALTTLLWPTFVEHQGCVLRASGFSAESFEGFMSATEHDKRAVERVLNHVHMADVFATDLSHEQAIFLGRTIREMWEAKLVRNFPNRRFDVSFAEPENEDDVLDAEVTFCQLPSTV